MIESINSINSGIETITCVNPFNVVKKNTNMQKTNNLIPQKKTGQLNISEMAYAIEITNEQEDLKTIKEFFEEFKKGNLDPRVHTGIYDFVGVDGRIKIYTKKGATPDKDLVIFEIAMNDSPSVKISYESATYDRIIGCNRTRKV